MTIADQIREGLIQRGMAPHIAEAFIWNFADESGLDPSVVERVPNVHGTRGRGLYQLTGPRRDAFEGRYGEDYSIDNQLDWLMYELEGPENRAWQRIQGAGTTGEAAVAIVSDFLRPAAEHRDRRAQAYLNGNVTIPDRPSGVFTEPPGQNALAAANVNVDSAGQFNALEMTPERERRVNPLDPTVFMSSRNFNIVPYGRLLP